MYFVFCQVLDPVVPDSEKPDHVSWSQLSSIEPHAVANEVDVTYFLTYQPRPVNNTRMYNADFYPHNKGTWAMGLF